jgi:DNA-binding NarL/FixJ family response regulator
VYCHDSTWQQALEALVATSDVVLMDLRSFKTHNRGCRHELGVLARAPRLGRVVVLTDADTDRDDARTAAAGAPPGRFSWIDTSRIDAAKRREVLAALFVADTAVSA